MIKENDILERLKSGGVISLDESTTIFPPFYTNFGKFINIGKDVFINMPALFLIWGITIEDGALIGPRVNLVTENHPLDPDHRSKLVTKPIIIKRKECHVAKASK